MRRCAAPRFSPLRALAAAPLVASLILLPAAASAKTFHPTRTDDPAPNGCKKNDCSLREAVIAANADLPSATTPGQSIVLRPGREYELTRKGAGEDASMTGDLDLDGARVKTKKGRGARLAVIDGNDIDRIFDGAVTLARVVLRDGHARAAVGDDGNGGAIRGGKLILKSRLVGNVADGKGGAVFNEVRLPINRTLLKGNRAAGDGGAVFFFRSYCDRDRDLEIANSRVIRNSAGGAGGAIFGFCSVGIRKTYLGGNRAEGPGGAVFSPNVPGTNGPGFAWILDSTVAGNQSESYGGGLAVEAGGGAKVERSTVSGNSADSGGGIGTLSGLLVENSTIANNGSDRNGGGIGAFGHAIVQLDSTTVARNAADEGHNGGSQGPGAGGGLYQEVDSVISVRNTIVALNGRRSSAPSPGPDCYTVASGGFHSLGHNLIGDAADCPGFGVSGDLFGGPLKLGKLANNGGPTKTIALKRGSIAIDHAGAGAGTDDQRGVSRPKLGDKRGKKPDIGAYEQVVKK